MLSRTIKNKLRRGEEIIKRTGCSLDMLEEFPSFPDHILAVEEKYATTIKKNVKQLTLLVLEIETVREIRSRREFTKTSLTTGESSITRRQRRKFSNQLLIKTVGSCLAKKIVYIHA